MGENCDAQGVYIFDVRTNRERDDISSREGAGYDKKTKRRIEMTKREAAIVTAYTGILIGDVRDFYDYVKEIMGRSYMTHEYADQELWAEIKERTKGDFINIRVEK